MDGAQFYSHVLPSPEAATIRGRRIVGKNWAMAGDAAACVDPLTGEGLYYALRSGDLLAQALMEGQPQAYPERLRAAFSADLEFAANIARRIFRGNILGGAITTRDGAAAESFARVPRFDRRRVQRLAGLSQPERPAVESDRRHVPGVHAQLADPRWLFVAPRQVRREPLP